MQADVNTVYNTLYNSNRLESPYQYEDRYSSELSWARTLLNCYFLLFLNFILQEEFSGLPEAHPEALRWTLAAFCSVHTASVMLRSGLWGGWSVTDGEIRLFFALFSLSWKPGKLLKKYKKFWLFGRKKRCRHKWRTWDCLWGETDALFLCRHWRRHMTLFPLWIVSRFESMVQTWGWPLTHVTNYIAVQRNKCNNLIEDRMQQFDLSYFAVSKHYGHLRDAKLFFKEIQSWSVSLTTPYIRHFNVPFDLGSWNGMLQLRHAV